MERLLVVLCGPPASGKSTFAQNNFNNIISPDAIRLGAGTRFNRLLEKKVWSLATYAVTVGIINEGVICFDATSVTKKDRKYLIDIGKEWEARVECHYFPTPIEVCKERNSARKYPVPEYVLDSMFSKLEPPILEEGFDSIIVHQNCQKEVT